MLYMIVERFKDGDARPMYERFRRAGRMAPDGLAYVSSWVDSQLQICFQLMETDDPALIDQWIARWSDLVVFEVYPLMSSDAAAAITSSPDPNRSEH
jgi:Protein of unknown function (DUF3303)